MPQGHISDLQVPRGAAGGGSVHHLGDGQGGSRDWGCCHPSHPRALLGHRGRWHSHIRNGEEELRQSWAHSPGSTSEITHSLVLHSPALSLNYSTAPSERFPAARTWLCSTPAPWGHNLPKEASAQSGCPGPGSTHQALSKARRAAHTSKLT